MSGRQRHVLYPVVAVVLLVVGAHLSGRGVQAVTAQVSAPSLEDNDQATQWHLVLDGSPTAWPDTVSTGRLDSLQAVGHRVLTHLRRKGYYYATLDSATVDTSATPALVRLYARRGPQAHLAELRLEGDSVVSEEELRALIETEVGKPLRPARLETDIRAILDRYEAIGRPLAQVRVAEMRLTTRDPPRLRVTLRVEEGPELWLKQIKVPDAARTTPELLAYLADLEVGAPLRNYDPEAIQRRLQTHDLFEEVETPELRVDANGGAVLRIPVEEAAPGVFDFVLGYLPPSQTRESGQLVGSGHLLLKHLFGGGRTADFTLDRRPGQTSIFDVSLSDPYLFGLPLQIEGHFRGEQRDSTYGERTYELGGGYRLGSGLTLTATVSREVVRPGPAGTSFLDGRQQIARATTLFYGVGLRYQQLDRPQNPRRGLSVDVQAAHGRKARRRQRITAEGDTAQVSTSLQQERLRARLRAYLPLFDRQVLAIGGESAVLLSRDYGRSDLFRLGGATTLRGYDEDRFLGNVVARGLVEYRLQLDRASYTHAFFDLGYVARPALAATSATRGWHPGYGLGLQLQTALGRISATYALNPDMQSPANGRVHLGLSVGL